MGRFRKGNILLDDILNPSDQVFHCRVNICDGRKIAYLGLFGLWLACLPFSIKVVVQNGTNEVEKRKQIKWGNGLTLGGVFPNPT